ncbi:MAG: hypothetical protein ACJ789_16130 [Thermomicrobiales bacterium]
MFEAHRATDLGGFFLAETDIEVAISFGLLQGKDFFRLVESVDLKRDHDIKLPTLGAHRAIL